MARLSPRRLLLLLPPLLLLLLAAPLAQQQHAALAQDIRSPFPSRSAILAAERRAAAQLNASESHQGADLRLDARNVLGYVTPWNPRGTLLVEKYRHKFTHVAPCWHTVDPVHTGATTWYEVRGEPTEEDAQWMRRLQAPQPGAEDEAVIKVVPRFALDNTWTAELLAELLSSDRHLRSFVDGVVSHVQAQGYDGLVLEVGAVWALEHLIAELGEALHKDGKLLGIVLPPFRRIKEGEEASEEARMNRIALQAYKALSPLVDLITSMTYDYSGTSGLAYADIFDVDALPEKSPLRQEGVRVPGPNTPLEWLRENVEMLQGTLEVDGGAADGLFGPGSGAGFAAAGYDMTTAQYVEHHGVRQKLLMGFPLYGYAYPIGWFDQASESTQGVPKIPPPSPLVSKDNDTDAQAAARARADKKESDSRLQAVLRFAGAPFTHNELIARLEDHKALVRQEPQSGEQYIDFVAAMPAHQQPKDVPADANGGKPFASYYRAFWPSAHTMAMRAAVLADYADVGVALWDVGQAGEWLLAEL